LTLAVATRVSPAEFPDGVYLVELVALTDGEQVSRAMASTIRAPEQPGAEPVHMLVEALRTRCVLLVLDNCEHLVTACAELVDALLRSCTAASPGDQP
jgi:predicted ATPase